jgi:SulP family sulfate permease
LLDSAGAEWLANEATDLKKRGGVLYLSSAKEQADQVLKRGNFDKIIGVDHIFSRKEEAIQAIVPLLDHETCATCSARIFQECPESKLEAKL